MSQESVTEKPQYVPDNYGTAFKEGCVLFPDIQDWYKGTGVVTADHPLRESIPFEGCGNCSNKKVDIIAAQYTVHPNSGDAYWDYEVFCDECDRFTQRSFAEN